MTNYMDLNRIYSDELNDCINYVQLSKSASHDMEKQLFKDIAKEECEHAAAIKHILEKAGMFEESDSVHELEEQAKKKLDEV